MATNDQRVSPPVPLVALVLAWLIPGAGHWYLRRRARAVIIFIAIGATFWAGMAMGGALTVDPINAKWWFVADTMTGVHGLAGYAIQKSAYSKITAHPDTLEPAELDAALKKAGIAITPPLDTVPRSYTGVAGMLNLLCIVDALMLAIMGIRQETATRRPREQAA